VVEKLKSEQDCDYYLTSLLLESIADAPLKKVLTHWQGLGYNRRALGLYRAATMVAREMGGKIPDTFEGLCALPGVGPYTAGAVMAFAYNKPVPIIETNIRSVFIHFFFNKNTRAQTHNQPATRMSREIQDKDILLLVEATLDVARPREWYYALMDYGAMLKKTIGNPNVHSKHYTRQSQFKGSNRQLRAAIVRAITKKSMNSAVLFQSILADHPHFTKDHIQKNIDTLISEGFLRKKNDTLCVP
jgi:A/G-specific adenine glycosylase